MKLDDIVTESLNQPHKYRSDMDEGFAVYHFKSGRVKYRISFKKSQDEMWIGKAENVNHKYDDKMRQTIATIIAISNEFLTMYEPAYVDLELSIKSEEIGDGRSLIERAVRGRILSNYKLDGIDHGMSLHSNEQNFNVMLRRMN